MFTNLILSFALSAFITNSVPLPVSHIEDNVFKMNSQILLLNSVSLIYTDIFLCTKPLLNTPISYSKNIYTNYEYINNNKTDEYTLTISYSPNYYHSEVNPIASLLFKHNLWEIGFLSANIFNSIAVTTLNSIDNSGISGYCYSLLINLAEVYAISTWGLKYVEVVPLLVYKF